MSRIRLGRRGRRIVLFVSALLGLVAIVAMLVFDPLVRWLVVQEAHERGVELTLGSVQARWSRVALRRFSFRLLGVEGLLGEVEQLDIGVRGTTPKSIEAHGLRLDTWGAPLGLALSLSSWASAHPELLALPTRAHEVSLSWRPAQQAEPWVELRDAVVAPETTGGGDLGGELSLLGRRLGRLRLSWTAREARASLAWSTGTAAALRGTLRWADPRPQATLTLAPTPLARLSESFQLPSMPSGVTVGGRLDLTLEQLAGPARPVGQLELVVQGFKPPLPPEARAIAFGNTTEVSSRVRIDVAQRRAALDELRVSHGGLALRGHGQLQLRAASVVATLKLSGSLSCAELARAAAQGRVGGALGRLVGGVAGRVVGGSVSVDVDVVADLRQLDAAEIKPRIGVGCNLRPGALLPPLPSW